MWVACPAAAVCIHGDGAPKPPDPNLPYTHTLSFSRHVHKSYPVESRFDNTDAYVVSGSEDGALHFYDLVEGKTLATYVCVCARRWK